MRRSRAQARSAESSVLTFGGVGRRRPSGAWPAVGAVLLGLACLAAACSTGSAPGPRDLVGAPEVDGIFQEWDASTSPGCAVAVVKDGSIVYTRSYGMADLDHGITIQSAPVFHAASLAKQFTATAILLLAADNKLTLDDQVRQHIPELPDLGFPLRIRHLLHHTSGLRDQWVLLTMAGWRLSDDVVKTGDVMWLVARMRDLNFTPGDQVLYSNTNFTLAALIVERVSGQSFRDFTRAKIFEKLGMSRTVFRETHGEIVKDHAYGYRRLPGRDYQLRMPNYDLVGPTNLLTTVEDLARWEGNFLTGTVGGPTLLQQLQTPGTLESGQTIPYGPGLFVLSYRGLPIVEHDGRDAGYRSHFLRFPNQRFAVAVLCNVALPDSMPARRLAQLVAEKYLSAQMTPPPSPTPPPPPSTLSPSEVAARVGAYWTAGTEEVAQVAAITATSLSLKFRGISCNLVQAGGNLYTCGIWNVEFTPAPAGGPGAMVLRRGTTSIPFDAMAPAASTPADLAAYQGRYYAFEIDTYYQVRLAGTELVIDRQKYASTPLQPIFLDGFAFQEIGLLGAGTLRFTRNGQGSVDGFLLTGDRTRHFRFARAQSQTP